MHVTGSQDIVLAQGNGWKATELRYAGANGTAPLAMTLILPDNMRAFERQLSTGQLERGPGRDQGRETSGSPS